MIDRKELLPTQQLRDAYHSPGTPLTMTRPPDLDALITQIQEEQGIADQAQAVEAALNFAKRLANDPTAQP